MTTKPKEEEIYVQGYWVGFEEARLLGGVSAAERGWEVGLGLLYKDKQLGVTGYLQYGLPILNCRLQMDLLKDKELSSHLSLGIPIPLNQFTLEPLLIWPLEETKEAKIGMRLQYHF